MAALQTTTMPGPLLERSAIGARIASLQGSYIEEVAKDKKAALKAQIVELSTKNRVLSDHTALLVLESESDYARFGIARTALSDIMTVGEGGLRLLQRSQLVLAAPDKPKPTKNEFNEGKKDKKKVGRGRPPSRVEDVLAGGDTGAMEEGQAEYESSAAMNGAAAPPPPSDDARRSEESPREMRADRLERDERPAPRRRSRRAPRPSAEPVSVSQSVASADGEADMDLDSDDANRNVRGPGEALEAVQKKPKTPALSGKMAVIHSMVESGQTYEAIAEALRWRNEESGNVMALVALGEALEAAGDLKLAARAYGSIIDLFPSRADLRRFAATRLANLETFGAELSVDSLRRAREQRPDHLSVHRLLAYSLVRAGDLRGAFDAIEQGLSRSYPSNRFAGGERILREDLGIVAAAWKAVDPKAEAEIKKRLAQAGVPLATKASTRFVLNWETDANDVDFHIRDGKGGHAYYSDKALPSGGELFADVTTGYGPECFSIPGTAKAYPYNLQIHYYSRGPMGYGMGQVEILQHDGKGGLSFDTRPFVVMTDGAFVDLGDLPAPL